MSQKKRSHIFLNKMLQKLQKNISTDGEVISKMKVASFFLGHGVYSSQVENIFHCQSNAA